MLKRRGITALDDNFLWICQYKHGSINYKKKYCMLKGAWYHDNLPKLDALLVVWIMTDD